MKFLKILALKKKVKYSAIQNEAKFTSMPLRNYGTLKKMQTNRTIRLVLLNWAKYSKMNENQSYNLRVVFLQHTFLLVFLSLKTDCSDWANFFLLHSRAPQKDAGSFTLHD